MIWCVVENPHLSLSAPQDMLHVLKTQQCRAGQPAQPGLDILPTQLLLLISDGLPRSSDDNKVNDAAMR